MVFGVVSSVVVVEAVVVKEVEDLGATEVVLVRWTFTTGLAGDTRFIILIFYKINCLLLLKLQILTNEYENEFH